MFTYGIVLAAGRGARMDSDVPKPAIIVDGKPIIKRIVDSLRGAAIDEIIVVVGYKKEYIEAILKNEVTYVVQKELSGTATAVKEVVPYIEEKSEVIIIPGDIPYLNKETVQSILNFHHISHNDLTVVSMSLEDPTGYGRIIKDQNRVKIVEERDATESEKKIKEVNTGIIVTMEKVIKDNIGKINNNNQKGEYYLTDIVELASLNNQVGVYHMANSIPVIGVNDLNALNSLQEKVKNNWQNDENVVK